MAKGDDVEQAEKIRQLAHKAAQACLRQRYAEEYQEVYRAELRVRMARAGLPMSIIARIQKDRKGEQNA